MSDVEKKVVEVTQLLRKQGLSLSLAESCTGGLLSSWVTALAGVSDIYQGSVVSYSKAVKKRALNVPSEDLEQFGEVSVEVAGHMAKGARLLMDSDWAVGITGIAGPTGGTESKPVGTVCFAISGPNFEKAFKHNFESSLARHKIQNLSAELALDLILNTLTSLESKE